MARLHSLAFALLVTCSCRARERSEPSSPVAPRPSVAAASASAPHDATSDAPAPRLKTVFTFPHDAGAAPSRCRVAGRRIGCVASSASGATFVEVSSIAAGAQSTPLPAGVASDVFAFDDRTIVGTTANGTAFTLTAVDRKSAEARAIVPDLKTAALSIALDAERVLFAIPLTFHAEGVPASGRIESVPRAGGKRTVVASQAGADLQVDDQGMAWIRPGPDQQVVVVTDAAGKARDVAAYGAIDMTMPHHVHLGPSSVYWLLTSSNALVRADRATATPPKPSFKAPKQPDDLEIVDGAPHLAIDGAIVRVDEATGKAEPVVRTDGAITGFTRLADGSWAWWNDDAIVARSE